MTRTACSHPCQGMSGKSLHARDSPWEENMTGHVDMSPRSRGNMQAAQQPVHSRCWKEPCKKSHTPVSKHCLMCSVSNKGDHNSCSIGDGGNRGCGNDNKTKMWPPGTKDLRQAMSSQKGSQKGSQDVVPSRKPSSEQSSGLAELSSFTLKCLVGGSRSSHCRNVDQDLEGRQLEDWGWQQLKKLAGTVVMNWLVWDQSSVWACIKHGQLRHW